MPKKKGRKPFFEQDIKCAHCKGLNHVKVEKIVKVPAEPAVTELKITVEKASTRQVTL